MNDQLSPEKIYNGVLEGEISRSLAQDQLISLIEGSNLPELRSKAIDIVKKLKFRETDVYKTIENILLSDENALVRNSAAELICKLFFIEGLNSLKWVLEHEKSPLVLYTILKTSNSITSTGKRQLDPKLEELMYEIAKEIGITTSETPFILELESIFANNKPFYNLNFECYKVFKILRNSKELDAWLKIQDNQIISLTLNFFNWNYIKKNLECIESILKIDYLSLFLDTLKAYGNGDNLEHYIPSSIHILTHLKYLDISNNNLVELPETIKCLTHLEKLDLKSNNLTQIPEYIFLLPSLKELDVRNNPLLDFSFLHKRNFQTLVKYK